MDKLHKAYWKPFKYDSDIFKLLIRTFKDTHILHKFPSTNDIKGACYMSRERYTEPNGSESIIQNVLYWVSDVFGRKTASVFERRFTAALFSSRVVNYVFIKNIQEFKDTKGAFCLKVISNIEDYIANYVEFEGNIFNHELFSALGNISSIYHNDSYMSGRIKTTIDKLLTKMQ